MAETTTVRVRWWRNGTSWGDDPEARRVYLTARAELNLYETVASALVKAGLSRDELAERAGVSRRRIYEWLRRPHSMSVKRAVILLEAIDADLTFGAGPLAERRPTEPEVAARVEGERGE